MVSGAGSANLESSCEKKGYASCNHHEGHISVGLNYVEHYELRVMKGAHLYGLKSFKHCELVTGTQLAARSRLYVNGQKSLWLA